MCIISRVYFSIHNWLQKYAFNNGKAYKRNAIHNVGYGDAILTYL